MNKAKRAVKKSKNTTNKSIKNRKRVVKKTGGVKSVMDKAKAFMHAKLTPVLKRLIKNPSGTERILAGVLVLSLSLVFFSISFLKTTGKEKAPVKTSAKKITTEAKPSAVTPDVSENVPEEYTATENEGTWQPERFYLYEKELQIESIDTSMDSDWYCTVTDTEGNKYAVYQPYGITFAAASEGYIAKSDHKLSSRAKASWLNNIKSQGLDDHAYLVRIQNFPMLNRNDKIMPNGTDEIPKDMEYITEVIDIINLETGEVTPYERLYN